MSEPHEECMMKGRWEVLEEQLKNSEKNRVKEFQAISSRLQTYIETQTDLNTAHAALIAKVSEKVYGDGTFGLDTAVELNKQFSESEVARVEAQYNAEMKRVEQVLAKEILIVAESFNNKVKNIWVGVSLIMVALIGNIVKSFF
jgi:hypothetical protein